MFRKSSLLIAGVAVCVAVAGSVLAYKKFQTKPVVDTAMIELDREIDALTLRGKKNGAIEFARLGELFSKKAHLTGDNYWYLSASINAKRSLKMLPATNPTATLVLVDEAQSRNDFAEATRLVNKALKEDKTNRAAIAKSISLALATGDTKVSPEMVDGLIKEAPTLQSYVLRARVNVALGKDAEAIRDFELAISKSTKDQPNSGAWARTLLAQFYIHRGQLAKAETLLNEAISLSPFYAFAFDQSGELSFRKGDFAKAEKKISAAFTISSDPSYLLHLARVEEQQGKLKDARQHRVGAEQAIRKEFVNKDFHHRTDLAELLLSTNSNMSAVEALILMQQQVKLQKDAETLYFLAKAQSETGKWKEARETMATLIKSGAKRSTYYFRAGIIEAHFGKTEEANKYFSLAREMNPGSKLAQNNSSSPLGAKQAGLVF